MNFNIANRLRAEWNLINKGFYAVALPLSLGAVAISYDQPVGGVVLAYGAVASTLAGILSNLNVRTQIVEHAQQGNVPRDERVRLFLINKFSEPPIEDAPLSVEEINQLPTLDGLVERMRGGDLTTFIEVGKRAPILQPFIIRCAEEAGIEPYK